MERVEVKPGPETVEIFEKRYSTLVVDPYALNIISEGDRKNHTRLSFFSSFVAHTVREAIENGLLEEDGRVVLFGDASFGPNYDSTGKLIYEYLIREDREGGPIIPPDRVELFEDADLDQTSTQVKKLAKYLKQEDKKGEEVLYVGWPYHQKRVENHSKWYGINTVYGDVISLHRKFEPNFDYEKFMRIMENPLMEAEQMEKFRRFVSGFEPEGIIPQVVKNFPVIGKGSFMIDLDRREDGTLGFEYKPGKQKLREVGLIE